MIGSKNTAGFTIVEALISIFIFLLVSGSIFSILIASISNQKHTLAQQDLMNQTSFVAEYMSRALRQAQKELVGGATQCIPVRTNYELVLANPAHIRFLDADNICREFLLGASGELQEGKSSDSSAANLGAPADLISDDLELIQLRFIPEGETQTDSIQPRLTFFMQVKVKGGGGGEEPEIRLQTTVSQRRFDQEE